MNLTQRLNAQTARLKIRTKILELLHIKFHYDSQTHIAYHLGPGPEVKAFADWPDQAYESFITKLDEILKSASNEELEYWRKDLDI